MCLDDPMGPKKFDLRAMEITYVEDTCSFCKAGIDIDGAYKYGEDWAGREQYRTKK